MQPHDYLQLALYFGLLLVCTPLLGGFMATVFNGEKTWLSPVIAPLERLTYRVSGIDSVEEMSWKRYAASLLAFNLFGFLAVFGLMLLQNVLPLNPQGVNGTSVYLAFNTAVSFMTNTNWQAYSGEAALSYATQMLGLGVQNFVSAATGIAVIVAMARGIARRQASSLGNFWVDLTRATLYILLPLSLLLAIVLISQGVVQSFDSYVQATTLEGRSQMIPLGPAASQIAIKQLGTNGGGFFGVNSAHPFENPTPFSNFLQVFAILLIPAALTVTYGKLIGSAKQGWTIFAAMLTVLVVVLGVSLWSETQYNPVMQTAQQMEGKEQRFGVANSILWQMTTTVASNGSVNSMHDSSSPLAGGMALLNMMLGEVIFGGVGAGMYGMLMFVVLTVFIAGLMVGRTPEYLGKKIEAFEVQMAMIAILAPSAVILIGTMIAVLIPQGLNSLNNQGPHGFSEILYAFTSAAGNNGSAFAGLTVDTPFYNIALGFGMLIGRFGVILPALAIAGSMVTKKYTPPSLGTFPTDTPLFVMLLIAVILIVGALTFFPALSLGPIVEHLLMNAGRAF
ncbi:MAG: potassium-transporting ATPase subunit KdpA [Candidatus Kapabacteria bacterium]|jgi:K+-transporting ATPase ATPase A chain|nr:potassium-transporting ATPase subunit KdpA [Candidatus Kapabacteria bacterium]